MFLMKKIAVALVIILIIMLFIGYFLGIVGFPQIHAGNCKCFGIRRYSSDIRGVGRCACYGVTTWVWKE